MFTKKKKKKKQKRDNNRRNPIDATDNRTLIVVICIIPLVEQYQINIITEINESGIRCITIYPLVFA